MLVITGTRVFGKTLTIGTTKVRLFPDPTIAAKGVQLKADIANVDIISIGNSDVATTGAGLRYPLSPGDSVFIPLDALHNLYGVSGTAAQTLYALGV